MAMLLFLVQNVDIFAWSSYKVSRVDPEFIVHKLNVDPLYPPKKQRLRKSAKEHVEVVRQEVKRLKEAGAIKETFFSEWLVNIMVVKKNNGRWRVCVNFTNLNRACPKDPFPMSKIDQLNAGGTYQRMMTRMFRDKIGRTVEVYIDDMVCSFEVGAGKFLGYLITNQGIEVNPDQNEAVKCLKLLSSPNEVQKLTGMLAAFNWFISKFADQCPPFYQLSKKWKGFQWNEECEKDFQDLEEYLVQAPMLTALEPAKDLFMYLSVSEHVVNAMLLRDLGVQRPVYYLGSFDISYRPRSSVKSQVLADFVAEFSLRKEMEVICHVDVLPWKVFVDGASNATGAGAGIVIITPKGIRLEHSLRLGFGASNNKAEYEALIARLRAIRDMGSREVEIYSDSRLVVG
ncbi:uncharacterized protein LOC142639661 [Castanea sativa]|uniref:uncharacterized protein LOC142639661 n=1 Tax=Castanea sativa TaxID=21020 RepID=UPI003F64B312